MNEKNAGDKAAASESVAAGVSEVVTAALGVGAAMFRTLAEATAMGKPVAPAASGEGPFAELIHYGIETASNVARVVIRGIPSTVRPSAGAPPSPGPGPAYPTVHAGSTLRIPLSIENPTETEMIQMAFICEDIAYAGPQIERTLTPKHIVFQPAVLSVAPHDFEKLTVFISTDKETPPGVYSAKILLPGGAFESTLRFEVLPPGEPN